MSKVTPTDPSSRNTMKMLHEQEINVIYVSKLWGLFVTTAEPTFSWLTRTLYRQHKTSLWPKSLKCNPRWIIFLFFLSFLISNTSFFHHLYSAHSGNIYGHFCIRGPGDTARSKADLVSARWHLEFMGETGMITENKEAQGWVLWWVQINPFKAFVEKGHPEQNRVMVLRGCVLKPWCGPTGCKCFARIL